MGVTAENVAERYEVSREAQDEMAFMSHQRAVRAQTEGRFNEQIVSVSVPQRRGDPVLVSQDEHPRADTTIESLSLLKPVFKTGGTVTAGNSSGINDGAAALLIVSNKKCMQLGLKPIARVVAGAVAGVEPHRMGIGPVPATKKVLSRSGWSNESLDLIELNEAFAAQALPCITELGLDPSKVNVKGGAIALGHPVGCSGARIIVSLLHEMKRQGVRRGLATMCIGVGQGISSLLELT